MWILQAEANVKRGKIWRADGMGRRALLGGLGAAGALSLLGCPGNSGGPSPTPSPTPSGTPTNLPRGVPNATMFQNLGLVTALAQQYRPGSVWVRAVTAGITLEGTVTTTRRDQAWNYAFFSQTPTGSTLDIWEVYSSGETYVLWGLNQPNLFDLVDIRPVALIDSAQAMALALDSGLDRCTEGRNVDSWFMSCSYERRSGFAGVSIQLSDERNFFQGRVLLSSTTGELVSREIRC